MDSEEWKGVVKLDVNRVVTSGEPNMSRDDSDSIVDHIYQLPRSLSVKYQMLNVMRFPTDVMPSSTRIVFNGRLSNGILRFRSY